MLAQSSLRGKRARSHHFPPSYRRLSLEGVVSGCVPLGACFVAFVAPYIPRTRLYKILYLLIKPYFIPIFLQNIYTPIVHDNKEQNYLTFIISSENSESSLPASKSQSNSESDSPNKIIKGRTFSNERFPINFAQSSEISSSQ
jgi:hypothetical protein